VTTEKHLVLAVELPSVHTADLPAIIEEYRDEFNSESDCILNAIATHCVVRVRVQISGEKDGSVEEVWGSIREARLETASKGCSEESLAHAGGCLLRDEDDGCEWCESA